MTDTNTHRPAGDVAGFRLYGIERAIADVIEQHVDKETGELAEIPAADLDALGFERDRLLVELAIAAKGERAIAEALTNEAERIVEDLRARAARAQRRAERCLELVAARLPHGDKIKTDRGAISWRRSVAVEVTDERKLPEDCFRYAAPAPDKKRLAERLNRVAVLREALKSLPAGGESEQPEINAEAAKLRAELEASAFEGAELVERFSLVIR